MADPDAGTRAGAKDKSALRREARRKRKRKARVERNHRAKVARTRQAELEGQGDPPLPAEDSGVPNASANASAPKQSRPNQRNEEEKEDDELPASLTVEDVERALEKRKGTLSDWLNPSHHCFWSDLKKTWTKWPKATRKRLVSIDTAKCQAQLQLIEHPFPTDPDDHCETSPEAFQDVANVLSKLAKKLGKTDATLRIYDPYYCNGASKRNLAKLGFKSVYNECEDFYTKDPLPEHDVVVTNPPYSGDHVQKLLAFVDRNRKPALLLMPDYVETKSYFDKAGFTFIKPQKRYNYWTPKGLRPKDKKQNHVSALGIRTSPFISFWFCKLGN